MKKSYFFSTHARQWNTLLRKFNNLYKRIEKGDLSESQIARLVKKLQNIFKKLERMQYRVGVKLAGSAIALIMLTTTATVTAQNYVAADNLTAKNNPIFGSSVAPVFADIDGDGDLDVYVGNQNGQISVFINDGENNFTGNGNLKADGNIIDVGIYATPFFEDIDGDDDLDLYVGEQHGNINIFTNDGSGNFSAADNLQADGSDIIANYYSVPVFEDLDGDGDMDLYVGDNKGYIEVFTNNGSGSFTDSGNLQADDGSDIDVGVYVSPAFEDIDGDGDLDLYVGETNGNIFVFTNDGSGSFTDVGKLQIEGTTVDVGRASTPAFADIDDDGDMDLYIGNTDGYISIFENDGSGNLSTSGFMKANTYIMSGRSSTPVFCVTNVGADSKLYVGSDLGYIKTYTKAEDGTLTFSGNMQADGEDIAFNDCVSPAFADIDLDGDLDLYVFRYYDNIHVFTNNGSGVFTAAGNLKADGSDIFAYYHAHPTFADLDGDGDLDLYLGEESGSISVYENNLGVFTSVGNLQADGSDIDVENQAAYPVFYDKDGDGDLDLYVGNSDGNIMVYENSGSGIFTEEGNLQSVGEDIDIGSFAAPMFYDTNSDGDIDLCVGNSDGNIKVFLNSVATAIGGAVNDDLVLTVHPNPSSDIFNILLSDNLNSGVITVADVSGRVVERIDVSSNSMIIDLSSLLDGIYFITAVSNDNSETIKVIKQ